MHPLGLYVFPKSTVLSPAEKPREACFDPGSIMNGTRVGTDFKLGSTVTYQCDSGYKVVDPSSITCVIGADGKPSWDHALPSCHGGYGGRTWALPEVTACPWGGEVPSGSPRQSCHPPGSGHLAGGGRSIWFSRRVSRPRRFLDGSFPFTQIV